MTGGGPEHTSQSSLSGPSTVSAAQVSTLLTMTTINAFAVPLVGGDGTVYIVSGTGTSQGLIALSPSPNGDGPLSVKWSLNPLTGTSGTLASGAISADGRAVYITGHIGLVGRVFAMDVTTNPPTTTWTFATTGTRNSFLGAPVIGPDGVIYCSGTIVAGVYAIFPNGTQKWASTPAKACKGCTPTLSPDGSTVYIPDTVNTGYLYAHNTADGTVKWSIQVASLFSIPSPAQAVGTDGTIYVGGFWELWAVKPDGTKKWSASLDATTAFGASPTLSPDGTTVYFGNSNRLYAIRADNGVVRWTFSSGFDMSYTAVTGANGMVYCPNFGGVMSALYPNGTQAWSYNMGAVSTYVMGGGGPAIAPDHGGTVYISLSGGVRGFSTSPVTSSTVTR